MTFPINQDFKERDFVKEQKRATGKRKLAELDALIASNEAQLTKLNEMRRECINVYDLNKGDDNA